MKAANLLQAHHTHDPHRDRSSRIDLNSILETQQNLRDGFGYGVRRGTAGMLQMLLHPYQFANRLRAPPYQRVGQAGWNIQGSTKCS